MLMLILSLHKIVEIGLNFAINTQVLNCVISWILWLRPLRILRILLPWNSSLWWSEFGA